MPNICYSSETYHLDPQDLFILKDSLLSDEVNVSDEVVLLIGHNPIWIDKSTGTPDTLLKGRAVLEKAVADKVPYVPVRIAFIPKISRFDFISPLIRVSFPGQRLPVLQSEIQNGRGSACQHV